MREINFAIERPTRFLLRGQTVHWIGAQFFVYLFLDSIDKSSNMFKLCPNNQRKLKNKRRTNRKFRLVISGSINLPSRVCSAISVITCAFHNNWEHIKPTNVFLFYLNNQFQRTKMVFCLNLLTAKLQLMITFFSSKGLRGF